MREQALARQRFQVVLREPDELVVVGLRGRLTDALEREQPSEIFLREDLEVTVTPAEPRDVVQHRFGTEAAVAVALHRDRVLPLRELLAPRLDEQGHVAELRRLPAETLVDQQLPRRARHVLAAAQHVSDSHVVIVDPHGEVIDRRAIRSRDHEVVELGRVLARGPGDQVVPASESARVGNAQPNAEGLRAVRADLLVATGPVVARLLAPRLRALAHRRNLALRARAPVRVTARHELRDRLAVVSPTLGLARNAARSGNRVPGEAEPLERLEHELLRLERRALAV